MFAVEAAKIATIVKYLQEEIYKIPEGGRASAITEAFEELDGLKRGLAPQYSFNLTPQFYFMKYFLKNVYCADADLLDISILPLACP